MPRFVKWNKTKKTQDYWTILRLGKSIVIREGELRSGQTAGKTVDFATEAEALSAYDAEVAKKTKAKTWIRIMVEDVPTVIGQKQRFEIQSVPFAWELEVTGETTLATTTYRDGKPTGGNVVQCADRVERDGTAELLIAEKIATGYQRVDGGRAHTKALFLSTGYPM